MLDDKKTNEMRLMTMSIEILQMRQNKYKRLLSPMKLIFQKKYNMQIEKKTQLKNKIFFLKSYN